MNNSTAVAVPENVLPKKGRFVPSPNSKGRGGVIVGAGRPPGTKNKIPLLLKEAIIMAATVAGDEFADAEQKLSKKTGEKFDGTKRGLEKYLTVQAVSQPVAFLSLLGKVLPLTIVGDKDKPLVHKVMVELVAPGSR